MLWVWLWFSLDGWGKVNKMSVENDFKKKVKRFEDTLEVRPIGVVGFKRKRRKSA